MASTSRLQIQRSWWHTALPTSMPSMRRHGQNYKTKIGEIDIIAKKDDIIVFVEVKDRQTKKYGLPREAITPYKQNKIRVVATQYLMSKRLTNSKVRFDCIEILGDTISHIENAF